MLKNAKSPLFYQYFFSYVIVLAIPIIVLGTLLYSNINKSYQEEITDYRKINADYLINAFENEYKVLNSIALRIAFDKTMSMAVIKQNEYQARNASNTLNKYIQESRIIDEIYLCFKDDDMIYCSRGVMSIDTMFNSDFSFAQSEEYCFTEVLNNTKGILIKSISQTANGHQAKSPVVVAAYSLPYGNKNSYGTMAFIIKEDKINKVLGLDDGNVSDFSFYIFNKDREAIYTNRNENISNSNLLIDVLEGNRNPHDDKGNFVINMKSDLKELDYVVIYPNKRIGGLLEKNLQVFIVFVTIIILGIYIASLMATKNYKPIKNIIDSFFNMTDRRTRYKHLNEIEYINNLIHETLDKNKRLLLKLEEQLPFMKEQILLMLIKGETVNSTLAESLLNSCGISFNYNYFQVVVISISNYSRDEIVSGRVSNIIKLLLSEDSLKTNNYLIELLGGDRVIILNGNKEDLEKTKIKDMCVKIQYTLKAQLKIKTNIGIGSITNLLEYVTVSFEEAQCALNYKLISGYGNVIFYTDCVRESSNVFWYPMEEMTSVSNYLLQGDAVNAIECINIVFANIKNRNIALGISKSIGFGIINTIIRIINEYNISGYEEEIENLSNFQSIEELENGLISIINMICNYFNEYKSKKNNKLKVELIKYINENFTNPLMSLEMISDEFSLTDKYLSKFFYESTGYKFADYIKRLRIDYAKRLLTKTSKTVKEIVQMSGYIDPSSFIRTFNSLEGVTPGKYRELNKM